MSEPTFTGPDGKTHRPGEADYEAARFANLEDSYGELLKAVVDLQHRVARLDGESVQWPGDTYEPRNTEPA